MKAGANSIILHHYEMSPFSEKIRVVFGIKDLSWFACDEPVIMPKPELTALTGGYRKIPVMQIGADIYCDTRAIIRELERRFPTPDPNPGQDLGLTLSFWADRTLFGAIVTVVFGAGQFRVEDAFIKDREALTGQRFNPDAMAAAVPGALSSIRAHLIDLESILADGRAFIAGERPSITDAAVFHNLNFVRLGFPDGHPIMKTMPRLSAWEARVRTIGHGRRAEITRDEALEIARSAESIQKVEHDPDDPMGLRPGDKIRIAADDYGRDWIDGELVALSADHIAIRRRDDRVGGVVVHFPRAGFVVTRA